MNIFFDTCRGASDYASETRSIGVFYSEEKNINLNIHTHDCCEIFFCVKGGKNFLIDNKVYKVHDGDIFLMNQFEAHKITFEDRLAIERYALQLHPEFIFSASTDKTDLAKCFYSRSKETSNCISLSVEDREYVTGLFEGMRADGGYGDDVMKKLLVTELLVFINKRFMTNHSGEEKVQNEQLKKAIRYINEHLDEELSLEMIAGSAFISVNQLCKLFKTTLGTTVMKYIIGKRISQAKKFLNSGYSVSEAAFMCGFRDYSNFIRSFTQSVGISPGRYKKENVGQG